MNSDSIHSYKCRNLSGIGAEGGNPARSTPRYTGSPGLISSLGRFGAPVAPHRKSGRLGPPPPPPPPPPPLPPPRPPRPCRCCCCPIAGTPASAPETGIVIAPVIGSTTTGTYTVCPAAVVVNVIALGCRFPAKPRRRRRRRRRPVARSRTTRAAPPRRETPSSLATRASPRPPPPRPRTRRFLSAACGSPIRLAAETPARTSRRRTDGRRPS